MKRGYSGNPDQSRRGNWVTTIMLVVVGVAYLYFWFLPNRNEIADLRNELRAQREIAARAATVQMNVEQTRARAEDARDYVTGWQQDSPTVTRLPGLYSDISDTLQTAGCQTTGFHPRQQQPLAHLTRTPLEISMHSDLAGLFAALRGIEQLSAQTWVESLVIERPAKRRTLRSEVTLVIFSEISDKSN